MCVADNIWPANYGLSGSVIDERNLQLNNKKNVSGKGVWSGDIKESGRMIKAKKILCTAELNVQYRLIAHALAERSWLPLEMAPREPPASPYVHSHNSATLTSNPSNTTVRSQLNSTPLTSLPSIVPETSTTAMKSPKFLPVLKVFDPRDPRNLTEF